MSLLKDTKIDLTKSYFVPGGGEGYLGNIFDITPKDFLRFARQDLKQNDERGLINSLTNSKRAIDCQIDEVLEKTGIKSNDFNPDIINFLKYFELDEAVPVKLRIIHALNFAPSLIISKARSLRNKLEHLYQKPSTSEVKEALDIADLFIRSVEGKFNLPTNEFYLTDIHNYDPDSHWDFANGLDFEFDLKKLYFKIYKRINTKRLDETIINSTDKEFFGLLRLMFSIEDEIELEESFRAILNHIEHPIPSKKVKLIHA